MGQKKHEIPYITELKTLINDDLNKIHNILLSTDSIIDEVKFGNWILPIPLIRIYELSKLIKSHFDGNEHLNLERRIFNEFQLITNELKIIKMNRSYNRELEDVLLKLLTIHKKYVFLVSRWNFKLPFDLSDFRRDLSEINYTFSEFRKTLMEGHIIRPFVRTSLLIDELNIWEWELIIPEIKLRIIKIMQDLQLYGSDLIKEKNEIGMAIQKFLDYGDYIKEEFKWGPNNLLETD